MQLNLKYICTNGLGSTHTVQRSRNITQENQSPYNFVQVAPTGMEQRQWSKKCVQKDNRLPIFYNVKTFESVTKYVITLVMLV